MDRNNQGDVHHDIVSWTLSGTYDPDKPVLIDAICPERTLSKNQAVRLIEELRGSFAADSTVCLHLANDILYPVLTLAVLASKCRWTGTNTAYTAAELAHHFRKSDTRYVITRKEHLPAVSTAMKECERNITVILFSDLLAATSSSRIGCQTRSTRHDSIVGEHHVSKPHDKIECAGCVRGPVFADLNAFRRSGGDERTLRAALSDIRQDSIASLMSTSGTTGLPKMAARTHRAMILESKSIEDNNSAKPFAVRRLYCTPIFHAFSAPEMLINSLRLGLPTYFMPRFDDDIFPQKIQEFGITEIAAPPPMLLRLLASPSAHARIQSVRTVFTGGAPLLEHTRTQFLRLFPPERRPRIVPVWGMTEGGWFTMLKYPEVDTTGSVGRCVPGAEVVVSTEHAVQMSPGLTAGELYVKSPFVMTCYLGNKAASKDAFEGAWFKTGDVGYVQDGRVYLIDRVKDLIKVNGWQVSPVEIENALHADKAVKDAAVIGVDSHTTEHPLAFVVPVHADVTKAQIKDHLQRTLARYKVRYCAIEFVDAIPKSVSGKILRRQLREMAKTVR